MPSINTTLASAQDVLAKVLSCAEDQANRQAEGQADIDEMIGSIANIRDGVIPPFPPELVDMKGLAVPESLRLQALAEMTRDWRVIWSYGSNVPIPLLFAGMAHRCEELMRSASNAVLDDIRRFNELAALWPITLP